MVCAARSNTQSALDNRIKPVNEVFHKPDDEKSCLIFFNLRQSSFCFRRNKPWDQESAREVVHRLKKALLESIHMIENSIHH
jgi:hypothetical protein